MQGQRSQRGRPAPDPPNPLQAPPQRSLTSPSTTPYLQPRMQRRPRPPVPLPDSSSSSIMYNNSSFPSSTSSDPQSSSQPVIVRRPKRPPPGAPRRTNAATPPISSTSDIITSSSSISNESNSFPFPPARSQSSEKPRSRLSPGSFSRAAFPGSSESTPYFKTSSDPPPTNFTSSISPQYSASNVMHSEPQTTPPFVLLEDLKGFSPPNRPKVDKDIPSPPNSTNELLLSQPLTKLNPPISKSSTFSITKNFFDAISPNSASSSSPSSYTSISPTSSPSEPLDFIFSAPKLRMFWIRMNERMQLEQKLKQTALDTLYLHAKQPDLVALTQTQLVRTFERIEVIYQGMIQFLINNQPDARPIMNEEQKKDEAPMDTKLLFETNEKGVHAQFLNNDLAVAYEELQTKYNEQSIQFAELLAKTIRQPSSTYSADNQMQSFSNEPESSFSSRPFSQESDATNTSADTDDEKARNFDTYIEEQQETENSKSTLSSPSQKLYDTERELEERKRQCEALESELASLRVEANAHQDVLDLAYSREAQLLERLTQYENKSLSNTVDQSVSTDIEIAAMDSRNIPSHTVSVNSDDRETVENLKADLQLSIEREMDLKIKVLEAQEELEVTQIKEKKNTKQIQDLTSELDKLRSLLEDAEHASTQARAAELNSIDKNVIEELRKSKEAAEQRCKILEAQLEDIQSQKSNAARLETINSNMEKEYVQLKSDILELTEEKYEMEEKYEALSQKLSVTAAELEDLRLSYTKRYEADLVKLETELLRATKEKDTILNEFDIMVMQSTEWMEKSRNLESKLEKLEAKLREMETQLEEARALGVHDGGSSHVQLRAEFRKQLQSIQSEHRKVMDLEIQEKEKVESDFREYKKEIQMQKFKKVTMGVQTYGVYTGDIGALG